ncbi:hypothetical protein KX729_09005 [Rhizobium sp. XQZ8]|uniref:hypothetical protein n=1 Tax=Rhizobium populisoli TaxID=2859785 RepID=UPI001CA56201|nr:hypothetical protein [Rhizobium populisoli]MBW6421576.1 hypothetical protein [Rhizobium populisoli]
MREILGSVPTGNAGRRVLQIFFDGRLQDHKTAGNSSRVRFAPGFDGGDSYSALKSLGMKLPKPSGLI